MNRNRRNFFGSVRGFTLSASLFLASIPVWFNALAAEKITFHHFDALGSTVAATNDQGNVVWRETYQPYGERIQNQSAAQSNSRWYTGHPQDTETGLVYAGARYYDPVIGRFMATDPKGFSETNLHSFNRYAYVSNNPYKYIDPDGLELVFAQGSAPVFKNKTNAQLDRLRTTPTGKAAIDRLEKSKNVFELKEADRSRAAPNNEKAAKDRTGTGGTIYHNPDWKPEVDTTQGVQATPSEIVLGHELHHATDYDRGTLDRTNNPDTGIRKSEEAAVKTENKIRRELGRPEERRGYQ